LNRSKIVAGIVVLALLIALGRVLASYSTTAQTFDEPCHVAAAIELLDRGTYQLDPYNTPLARIAIGLPLYLSGARMPRYAPDDLAGRNYNDVGNRILHTGNSYQHNLVLARYGVLPFLLLSTLVVFFWSRREYGDIAGLMAVFLFTTLPTILAFSSIAYSDIAAAFAQPAALFAFALWLEKPTRKNAAWLGITAGLALLAKFTTLIFLPAGAASILAVRWFWSRRATNSKSAMTWPVFASQIAAIGLIAALVVWGGYRFSIGRVQESMVLSPAAMPTFQHFPAPMRSELRELILKNPPVPAPGLLQGVAEAYVFGKEEPPSYFLGQIKPGGWWYFFFVDLALKSPPAFLLLSLIGLIALFLERREDQNQNPRQDRKLAWTALAPAAPIFAILLATTTTKVYYGVRHVIVLFPLLAIVAGYGAAYLWRVDGRRRPAARFLLAGLLVWQIISSASAGRDFLAYFNFLAGRDPSKVFVGGCDLDCGQDLVLLSRELHARNVSHVTLAVWTSADMSQTDLPPFEVPQPYQPVTGWFAISLRALRSGTVFHATYPQDAFAWLNQYQPVQRVGKTILLYYIPDATNSRTSHSAAQ
jgi:hypothetical protein